MEVNLVLVPATVTDPMNRLVTGLEKEKLRDLRQQYWSDHQELFD